MALALIFIGMTLAALAPVLLPLVRKPKANAARVAYDIVVYRDQLVEVDKDVERKLLTEGQASTARTEIYRRMLAAEDAERAVSEEKSDLYSSRRGRVVMAVALAIVILFGAGILYVQLGSPELPGRPYASRAAEPDIILTTEAKNLAAALERKPDAEGYKHLGDSFTELHRYEEAIVAYHKVIELKGGNAAVWSSLGEATGMVNDGMIVPEAREAFLQALKFDPHDVRARFYLGLAELQINEPRKAVAIWRDLEKDSTADSPWLPMLKKHVASAAEKGGFDADKIPPAPALTAVIKRK
jgi:cytochrome c-type biogenesis protein CcmH